MAKVFPKDSDGVHEWLGEGRWCEIVGYTMKGEKIHWLYKCDTEFIPFRGAGPTVRTKIPHDLTASTMSYIPLEKYGELFVFWDEKPTEPYFKDGWPEWEIISE